MKNNKYVDVSPEKILKSCEESAKYIKKLRKNLVRDWPLPVGFGDNKE